MTTRLLTLPAAGIARAATTMPRLIPAAAAATTTPSLLLRSHQQQLTGPRRLFSSSPPVGSRAEGGGGEEDDDIASSMTPAESAIASTLSSHESLRPTASVLVRDVSGGCGSMYAIDIASPRFRGKNLLAQQRLVNRALGDQVKQWHGLQIRTSVPPEQGSS